MQPSTPLMQTHNSFFPALITQALNLNLDSTSFRVGSCLESVDGILQSESVGDQITELDDTALDQPDSLRPCVAVAVLELEIDLPCGQAHEGNLDLVLADANDEDLAAELDGLNSAGNRGLHTCALESVGRLNVVCEFEDCASEVVDRVAEFNLVCEDAGDELAGKVEAALVDVGNDEGSGACSLCAEQCDETNGPSTANEHGVTEPDVRSVKPSKGDRERLEHSTVLEGHTVGHLVAPHRGVLEVAAEQTCDGRGGKKFDGRATVVAACQAGLALVADDVGLDCDAVTNLKVCDGLVNSHYHAGRLVTEDVCIFNNHRTDASLALLVPGVLGDLHSEST
jgi:hypothetical protein